ncbi:DUF1573 domain-containing protein [Flavobacteriales bacterium]|nr:DUF1573 domain-containing protein [Flavobacteriales bacterium]MDC3336240.1 DUF1573 domain-containing protein [Flavobacteriales bacterium]
MNSDKIKIGLLALIALTLIINTYYQATGSSSLPQANNSKGNLSSYSNIPTSENEEIVDKTKEVQDINPLKNPNLNTLPITEPTAPNTGPVTNIKFATDVVNFGKIKAQSENKYAFEFVNTGTEPLLIENAKGSCGCTVPNWPKDPIMPGEKGAIDVVFRPKTRESEGEDKKTVTVFSNTNPKTTVLTVKAMVSP